MNNQFELNEDYYELDFSEYIVPDFPGLKSDKICVEAEFINENILKNKEESLKKQFERKSLTLDDELIVLTFENGNKIRLNSSEWLIFSWQRA